MGWLRLIGMEARVVMRPDFTTLTPFSSSTSVREPRLHTSAITWWPARACASASTRTWFSMPPSTGK